MARAQEGYKDNFTSGCGDDAEIAISGRRKRDARLAGNTDWSNYPSKATASFI